MSERLTRRRFLEATASLIAAPVLFQGCAASIREEVGFLAAPPVPVQPLPPDLQLPVRFEFNVYDVPVCGVACKVERAEEPGVLWASDDRVVFSYEGTGACAKATVTSAPQVVHDVHSEKFEVVASRKKVMRAKSSAELSKHMHGGAVTYEEGYYPTERSSLVPYVVTTEDAFDRQKRVFDTFRDQKFHTNELLIEWDDQAGAITRCVLDGEELDLE